VITGLALPSSATTADPARAAALDQAPSSAAKTAAKAPSEESTNPASPASASAAGSSAPRSQASTADPRAAAENGGAIQGSSANGSVAPAASGSFITAGSPVKTDAAPLYSDIQQMHFLSATTGWMIQDQGGVLTAKQPLNLLATQDGGLHWSQQPMPGQLVTGLGSADAKEGWAVVYDGSKASDSAQNPVYKRVQILHTADGGRNWKSQWSQASTYADSFPASHNLVVTGKNSAYAIVEGKLMIMRGSKWSPASFGYKDFVPQHLSFTDARSGWVSGIMPPKEGAVDAYDVVVLRTKDGGRTWSKQLAAGGAGENSDTGTLSSRAIDFADSQNGYVLTDDPSLMAGDLYRTSDGGAHWTKVQSKLRSHRPTLTDMDFADGKNGWIAASPGAGPVDGGLMVTHDGGRTFDPAAGVGYDLSFAQLLGGGNGYAVGATSMNCDYLIRTRDGGRSWSQVFPAPAPTDGLSFVDAQHGFGIGTMTGENRLLTTVDGGKSWKPGYAFGGSRRVFAVDFLNAKEGWVAAYPIEKAGQDMGQPSLDLLHTTDGGLTFTVLNWKPADDEDTYSLDRAAMHFTDSLHGTLLYGDAMNVTVLSTEDGGRSWKYSAHPPQKEASRYALNGRGELLSFGSSGKNEPTEFFRKSLEAPSWSFAGRWEQSRVSPIDAVFPDVDHGYLLTDIFEDAAGEGSGLQLLTTADGGASWTVHPIPAALQLYTYGARLDFLDAAHGWLLTPGRLLATQDGGRSWKLVH